MRYFSSFLLLVLACAKIVAPTGGPPDTTPPEITGIFPSPGFVEQIPTEVLVVFSEKIQISDGDIQLYPSASYLIDGNKISISPNVDDENKKLFILTLFSGIEDLHGNNFNGSETFVWNTLPPDSFGSVFVTLRRSGGGAVTSKARCDFFLLPDTTKPEITCYPDTLGNIAAQWLLPGNYRVVCYEDDDGGREWEPEREAGAYTSISLPAGDMQQLTMTMTIVDSIGPRISSVTAKDNRHVEIHWNEQITLDPETDYSISITGPDSIPVDVFGAGLTGGRGSSGLMTLFTGPISDTLYSVAIEGIPDLEGNTSLPDTLEFWGSDSLSGVPFTVLSAYPEDGATGVAPAGPFSIVFSDWVDLSLLDSLYRVTTVADSLEVDGKLARVSPTAFSFTPETELLGNRQYRIDLLPGLVSFQGDTLGRQSWTFIPEWSDRPGSISGTISGTGASVVTVVVSPAGSAAETKTAQFVPGVYTFSGIPGGRYTVSVFVDRNSDEVWNPGEPYGAWPGIVEVFPGIDTKNIDVKVVP